MIKKILFIIFFLLSIGISAVFPKNSVQYDLIIRHGHIIDGTGSKGERGERDQVQR